MKTLKSLFAIAIFSVALVSCKNETAPEVKTVAMETTKEISTEVNENAVLAKAQFNIDGMTCEVGCAKTIEKKIAKMDGVKSAKVDFGKKLAMVEFDEAKVTTTSLEETVTKVSKMYVVSNMAKVEDFSTTKACKGNCEKACCKDKTEAEKMACKEDCKKECCAEKKEA
ncbi:MAG: heavy metal transporter [Bacteroidetes bacterium MedPE-SWsnd-G2]|nr:MAG: heavy metal transporter [Bacteroidetes bacterium MedPE-SWsnd-G2]